MSRTPRTPRASRSSASPASVPEMQTMSVTAALKELKLLNRRIRTKIAGLQSVRVRRSSTDQLGGVGSEAFKKEAQAAYQSVLSLIIRRDAIKAEIVRSNAQHEVTIAGQVMTVAAAIERKRAIEARAGSSRRRLDEDDAPPTLETLVAHLRAQYTQAVKEEQALVSRMEQERESRLSAFLSGGSSSQGAASQSEEMAQIEAVYRAANTPVLDDPLDLARTLGVMEDSLLVFASEVDRVLDEHNATARISVPAQV